MEGDKTVLLSKFTQVIERDPDDIGRMRDIYDQAQKNILEFKPKILCIERSLGGGLQFVRGNLSEGVGVVKMCCHDMGVLVYEVSPGHLKKIITGNGRAKKKHIISNVAAWFGLDKKGVEHECDAVAFALCCMVDMGWQGYEIKVPYVEEPKKKAKFAEMLYQKDQPAKTQKSARDKE
jgi:Holliday junction resolvasome RuvABC endonuclease subunit